MRTAIRIMSAHQRYFALTFFLLAAGTVFAQVTSFSYQGRLSDASNPANGQYDFQFRLYDTLTVGTGTQQGGDVTVSNVTVTSGIFTVQLDFGACASCFNGSPRYLEIAVKQTSGSSFSTLGPRQPISSDPYAIRSLNSATADGLSVACVNCVTSSQIGSVSGSAVSGTIPVASVPAGNSNYIQNTALQQASSNFNISGTGTVGGALSADTVNATTQYNLNGNRVFQVTGAWAPNSNTFAGVGAGVANQPGALGSAGNFNSYFGKEAGFSNTTGNNNSFFGATAGFSNQSGFYNSFFGRSAGFSNTTGGDNSFFGLYAGFSNATGNGNSFFGRNAGLANTTGNYNIIIGAFADAGANNLTNATAIGSRALVSQSNSLVLGSINGVNGATADTEVGIGTAEPSTRLHVVGDAKVSATLSANVVNATAQYTISGERVFSISAQGDLFVGVDAGEANTGGGWNSFFGRAAGFSNTGYYNSFFGNSAGSNDTLGNGNTLIGFAADVGLGNLHNATAIGALALVSKSDSLVLGSINGINFATADTNVGIGTTSPQAPLHLQRDGNIGADWQKAQLRISGTTDTAMQLNLGYDTTNNRGVIQAGQAFVAFKDLLLNPSGGNIGIGTLSLSFKLHVNGSVAGVGPYQDVSDRRYKQSIQPISDALDKVLRLRGVSYDWRQDEFPEMNFGKGRRIGFIAQEVEQVVPEAVAKDDRGFYSVAYSSVTPLLVEAIKEQQKTVMQLKQENAELRDRVTALEQMMRKLIEKP